jgi:hypothetical protein
VSDPDSGLTDQPVPDLLDTSGRLRRLGIAAALATLVAVAVAFVCYGLARGDLEASSTYTNASRGSAWRFLGYMTGMAWILTFLASNWLLGRRSKRKDSFVAQAKVRRG